MLGIYISIEYEKQLLINKFFSEIILPINANREGTLQKSPLLLATRPELFHNFINQRLFCRRLLYDHKGIAHLFQGAL